MDAEPATKRQGRTYTGFGVKANPMISDLCENRQCLRFGGTKFSRNRDIETEDGLNCVIRCRGCGHLDTAVYTSIKLAETTENRKLTPA